MHHLSSSLRLLLSISQYRQSEIVQGLGKSVIYLMIIIKKKGFC